MFKNKKLILFIFLVVALGIFLWIKFRYPPLEAKPNPVPVDIIKELAERHKPMVVFDKNTLFYPVRFDGLRKIALEVDKQVVAELDITDSLRNASNRVGHPSALFDAVPANSLIYYYSLSTIPEKWQPEKIQKEFPDTLSLYVNASYDQYLKITYTIPFEGNQWRNHHRGDGAMFALYFEKKAGVYYPIKARAYMHLQYNEITYDENTITNSQQETRPIFFVTSGSHSTYRRPKKYEDVDGLPFLNVDETAKNGYAYCSDRTILIFIDETNNNIEKWAFLGAVYWGGSPNDRIHAKDDFLKNTPLLKNLPLGNKSAKMIFDPSAVFDRKRYSNTEFTIKDLTINCE